MSDGLNDRKNSTAGKKSSAHTGSVDHRSGNSSGQQKLPRRTPTELQPPLLKTQPSNQTARRRTQTGANGSAQGNARRAQQSAGNTRAAGNGSTRTGRTRVTSEQNGTQRTQQSAAGTGTRSVRQNHVETPEKREQRIRRNRELSRKRRRRQQMMRRARTILIIAAVAAAAVFGLVSLHRYRVKKAEEQAAAAAAAKAARTLQTYDASDVLHLSFQPLKLDDTTDTDGDGIPDSEDDLIDADGDGIADEGTDVDNDGIPDFHDDLIDADGDGVADNQTDADGDGIPDNEDDLIDADGDGVADLTVDTDGDGIADAAAGTVSSGDGLTVSEFNQILNELYQNDYVLVSPYSLASEDENGLSAGSVQVPKGKKPLIISEQNVNYTSGYDGHADTLMQTSDGTIVNSYTAADGSQAEGPVDVITCVDNFISSHDDFSYNGARGIIGITGGSGIFGYSIDEDTEIIGALSDETIASVEANEADTASDGTDETASDGTDTSEADESTAADASGDTTGSDTSGYEFSPDSSTESVTASSSSSSAGSAAQSKAISAAQKEHDAEIASNRSTLNSLITALRNEGWVFACNTYNFVSYASTYDIVKEDADKWKSSSGALVGDTDLLILPNGGDIGSWSGYTENNEKYAYLKSLGFKYYFVDTTQSKTWIQVTSDYVREGMHDIENLADYRKVMQM